ncbi:hypothetical protein COO91_05053 [Nostoc flagelliforme CCNUN1]|uniref:Uncharacterized protein n=1 Tax=Nostoc flagelliforme CCNUN1 TaxID=2038116 RepID=A0A2K8SWD2_9NOSO|nr:hypothetical protein COO91_05053 [Nostoc flagelliforme CCNUN1]
MFLSAKKQIKINYDTPNSKIITFTQPLSNTFCVPSRRSQAGRSQKIISINANN